MAPSPSSPQSNCDGTITCSVSGTTLSVTISGHTQYYVDSGGDTCVFVYGSLISVGGTNVSYLKAVGAELYSNEYLEYVNKTHTIDISGLSDGTYYVYLGDGSISGGYSRRMSANYATFTYSTHTKIIPGSGTSSDPYEISTATHLKDLMDYPTVYGLSSYYTLEDDIDMSGYSCTQIFGANTFSGNFNGNSHTISNIGISGSTYRGIFANYVQGTVSNVTFDKCILDYRGSESCCGVFCVCEGTLSYVNLTNSIIISYGANVGFCGACEGSTIDNCIVRNCYIRGYTYYVGGLAGSIRGITCTQCTVDRCTIIVQSGYSGGLAGYMDAGSYTDTITNATITKNSILGSSSNGGAIGYIETMN